LEETEEEEKRIFPRPIEAEMETSYIDYAMSVIVGRALPDVRDGLKPVHKRILYAMRDLGLDRSKPHKKSARVVGEVLGKYHPHGDMAVYDALARMAQDFSMRYMLIDGQGNMGSVDGDPPAAMRYTECRMDRITNELLADIDKDTVDFMENFDGSLKEPTVLPAKFPNLLVNGSSGIAVGMATNIPPHNLREVVDATIEIIDNPDIDVTELMNILRGPDFPTGGIIYGRRGVVEAYHTGRGRIRVRARVKIEEKAKDTQRIIVTEIPYMVNKARLIEKIAHLVKDKKIDGITDLRDESDKVGMRIVIDLRRGILEEVILNQLYKHTAMESTFGMINLALVNGEPKVLDIKTAITEFLSFREEVIRRRTEFDLKKARHRLHITEGLITAVDHLDDVIKLIRHSQTAEEARNGLIKTYLLSEEQAKAILEMRLQKLTGMELQALRDEEKELEKMIDGLEEILASTERIYEIIKEELTEIKEKYGDERRTEIVEHADDFDIEDLIPVEEVVVTITNTGYIKRLPCDTYRQQRRGGVGLKGMETKEEDFVVDLFITSSHDYILFFTNKGRVHWLKAWQLPAGGRHAKGKPIINMIPRLEKGETISEMIPIDEFDEDRFLLFGTKKGLVKKTKLSAYSRPRITGIWAIKLRPGDELVDVKLSDGTNEVMIGTRQGMAVRFSETEVRSTGRYSMGVIGARLKKKDDRVIGMAVVEPESVMLTVTQKGYGKRSKVDAYRKTKRGAQGVINLRIVDKNGPVVAIRHVKEDDELIITSVKGMVIRIPVEGIRVMGRATQGVKVMRMRKDDKVKALARMVPEKEEIEIIEEAESDDEEEPSED
jgi:DNA gyrase subunit A